MGPIQEQTKRAFAPDGPLAQAGYEDRAGQERMALAVAGAADEIEWTAVHAPTGMGKSLAYLVPGFYALKRALESARGLVISTANIALQEQLLKKDVPEISKALGIPVKAVLLKGRNNYLCWSRLSTAHAVFRGQRNPGVQDLLDWADTKGCDGDREHVPFPVNPSAWAQLSSGSAECLGKVCPYKDAQGELRPCFAEMARNVMGGADVLICNHYYLCAATPGPAALLAVDEGHALESAARGIMGTSMRYGGLQRLASQTAKLAKLDVSRVRSIVLDPFVRLLKDVDRYMGDRYRVRLLPGWRRNSPPLDMADLVALRNEIQVLKDGERNKIRKERFKQILKRMDKARMVGLAVSAGRPDPEDAIRLSKGDAWAVWAERGRNKGDLPVVHADQVDVRPMTAKLRRRYPRAVLTSATLAVGGDFGPLRMGLGMGAGEEAPPPPEQELVLPSPFPLSQQGVLVLPKGPGPKDRGWRDWAATQAVQAAKFAGGRSLILCSSWKMVGEISYLLRRSRPSFRVLVHGEAGRAQLRRAFREDVTSTLIGTRSFMEGLDVPGESLSCVVIDRIPFNAPGDPVEDVVGEVLSKRHGGISPWLLRSLPAACMLLEQASGRLIRSHKDRGALVLLDRRALGYTAMGRSVRAALPPFPMVEDLQAIKPVLAGESVPDAKPIGVVHAPTTHRPVKPSHLASAASRLAKW